MDRFVLTADLVTGVPDIDDQHRTLFGIANRVVDPSTIDKGEPFFREILTFLAGYVRYHFAAEEHVMTNSGYPRLEQHRRWHDNFRAEVAELTEAARTAGVSKALKLRVSFAVEDWLMGHIRMTDRDLADYLVQQLGPRIVRLPDVATLKQAGLIPADFHERFATAG
jgi:hemerythrin